MARSRSRPSHGLVLEQQESRPEFVDDYKSPYSLVLDQRKSRKGLQKTYQIFSICLGKSLRGFGTEKVQSLQKNNTKPIRNDLS